MYFNWNYVYVIGATIITFIAWQVSKDIRAAKGEQKIKLIKIYGGSLIVGVLIYLSISTSGIKNLLYQDQYNELAKDSNLTTEQTEKLKRDFEGWYNPVMEPYLEK